MSTVQVRPVTTPQEEQAFLRLPWTVYASEPNWTPPLWKEHIHFFDPAHNAELEHITMQKFVAWRGDTPVGTIIAHINHAYNDFHQEKAGMFGQFEVLNDQQAAAALFQAAEDWLRTQGMAHVIGPFTFSTNSELGVLIEGHEHPQAFMTTQAPPYYQTLIENCGYQKAKDLFSWARYLQAADLSERLQRVLGRVRSRPGLRLYTADMNNWEAETQKILYIYQNAWRSNWGFVPLSDAERHQLAANLKPLLDPRLIFLIDIDGQPAAFAAPVTDVYEPLRAARCRPGEPEIFQMARFLWHWKVRGMSKRSRLFLLGVTEAHRGLGLDSLLINEIFQTGRRLGYTFGEMSWTLEDNTAINSIIEVAGGEKYKVHRIYQKSLA